MSTRTATKPAPGYEDDFYAWTQDQAEKLRARSANEVDWDNVGEEIESLGRSQRKEIRSRLIVLLHHLLKWQYQPAQRTNSWRASIAEARQEINSEIDDSPSLKGYPAEILNRHYEIARLKAAAETRLPPSVFPVECPYGVEDVLDPAFPADLYQDLPE